ncbi:MAG: chromosome segregation protein SMC, partial [Granulicatella sp.]|nr:chromosome segregation protein SMC [Granulicatella sp.]
IGIASDLVQVDQTYQSIVRNILGTTVVAKTLDDAMKIAKVLQYRYRIVSLEGDVVNAGGSMTGGASKNHQQQSLVKRNSQLEALEQQLNKLKEYEKQVSEKWNQLETKWNEIVQKGTAIQEEETLLKQQLQEVRLELQYSKDEFNKINRQTLSQQYELDESIEQYEQLEQQYVETHEALRTITKENQAVKKELDYLQLSQEDRTQQLQEKQQELQEVGTRKARMQEQVQHQKKEFKQEKLSLKRLEEQVHLLESKKDEQNDLKEKNEADYNQTVKDYEAIKETVTALEEALDALKEERIQLEVLNKQTEVSRNQAQHQLQEYLKQQSKVETKANRFELAIDQKLQYLSEEYELTFEAAIEKTELTMSIEDASKAVRSLKQQIEQMGAVNLMAIEEYDKVQERFEFLTIQQQDLLDAKKNLEDTITEMDTEVTSRFKQTFDAISSQFQQTFPRLFGGGRASLELTDPTNLLETGIEIIAQPPGKKLQSLSLLSGGERAFTAIALLFAILEVKPVPFCLLDEVEAALDEANVARYGRYLKEFTKNTQFIVITHRRGTMEEADVLYGVTMQESGVSKLASVKFEDFDGLE